MIFHSLQKEEDMKRFALVALLAATLFGVASSASAATELKVKGSFEAAVEWSANEYDFDSGTRDADNNYIAQRMRTYFTYQTNENLKAVLGLEMDTVWGVGDNDFGGDLNAGGNDAFVGDDGIEVKHAYLDFTFPDTKINMKVGLQKVALPGVFGSPVLDDDASAVVVSAPINDMVGITAGYIRANDGSYGSVGAGADSADEYDAALLVVPVKLDGFSVTPYFAYAWIGDDGALAGSGGSGSGLDFGSSVIGDDASLRAWVLGANAKLTMFDPFTLQADLIYGQAKAEDYSTKGWYGALAASYKFPMVTPTVFVTYGSGATEDTDTDNYLPMLGASAEGWGVSAYVGGARQFSFSDDSFVTGTAQGTFATGVTLGDISFVEGLSHDLTIAYAKGTSSKDSGVAFDKGVHAWEVYMVNKYMIYENLAAINEIGFCSPHSDDADLDNSYLMTVGFQYKF